MRGDLAKPLAEQGAKPCYPPRLWAILRTRKASLILLSPSGLTLKKLLPSRCTSQDAHEQHPGTQRGSDGSWQIWDGTCPTFTEQPG